MFTFELIHVLRRAMDIAAWERAMSIDYQRNTSAAGATDGIFLLSAGLALMGVILWLNGAVFERRLLEKYPPDWTSEGMLRTAFCLASGLVLALALRRASGRNPRSFTDRILDGRMVAGAGLVGLAVLSITTFVMITAPQTLVHYVSELTLFGVAQEISIAVAIVLCLTAAARSKGLAAARVGVLSGPAVAGIAGLALFLLLMEEMSWGQHLVGWRAPAEFAANLQNETNLHNFHTNRFEFIYYSCAMLAFVALPFGWPRNPPALLKAADFYIPPRGFALVALPACAYLYEVWNIVPMQTGFFLALGISLILIFDTPKLPHGQLVLTTAMLIATAAAQFVFLATGNQLAVSYEIEEMRETQIAWLIFAYALWLFFRVEAERRAAAEQKGLSQETCLRGQPQK